MVTAAIVDYLQGKGLSLDRLARGSSDGAAIMLGAYSGVAARLKELVATLVDRDSLCCTLLVLSLAACDTAHKFPWFSKFENTLNQLYTHSSVRSAALAAVQKVLDAPQLKLQKSTDTRWLFFENAVHAVRLTVDAFVLVLLSEAASEGNATALGLVMYLKNLLL